MIEIPQRPPMGVADFPDGSIQFVIDRSQVWRNDGKTYSNKRINTLVDFGLIMGDCSFGSPEPQLVGINIPFRNGALDMTSYFGDINYSNRSIQATFFIPYGMDYEAIYSEFSNQVHGQRCQVTFSWNKDWYYRGRVIVGDLAMSAIDGYWGFPLSINAEPYKYNFKDVVLLNGVEVQEITINNKDNTFVKLYPSRMPIIPFFRGYDDKTGELLDYLDHTITVTHNYGVKTTLKPHTDYNPDIVILQEHDDNEDTNSSLAIKYTGEEYDASKGVVHKKINIYYVRGKLG